MRPKALPLWVIPLVLACLFLPLEGVGTKSDSALYLSRGLNIYKGYGYVDKELNPVVSRGPFFPVLIAISFLLFGVSIEHAFWVIRCFFVFNALLVYFLGARFYGKSVGLTASLFVLTSITIHNWSSVILIDNVLSFFIILFIPFVYIALEKRSFLSFLLSGTTLGIAFLFKELAIIFSPLPLLALILVPDFRDKRNVIGTVLMMGGMMAVIGPWAVHVYEVSGALTHLLGGGAPKVIHFLASPGQVAGGVHLLSAVNEYLRWLLNYYRHYFSGNFVLAPLFVMAWVFTMMRAVFMRERHDLIMLLALGLFLPIMIFQGGKGWRAGLSLPLFLLSYVCLSNFVLLAGGQAISGVTRLLSGHKQPQPTLRYGLVALVVVLMVAQVLGEKGMIKKWLGPSWNGMSYYVGGAWQVRGWHKPVVRQTGEWIVHHVPRGSRIMCDWYWADSLYFYAQGDYRIFQIPYLTYPRHLSPFRQSGIPTNRVERPLFIWPHLNKSDTDNHLRVLREGDLLMEIRGKHIDYIIVTYRRNFLCLYLDENPYFEEVLDLDEIKIFSVRGLQPLDHFDTRVGSATPDFLNKLSIERPMEFDRLKSEFLKGKLGLSDADINDMMERKYPPVDLYTEY